MRVEEDIRLCKTCLDKPRRQQVGRTIRGGRGGIRQLVAHWLRVHDVKWAFSLWGAFRRAQTWLLLKITRRDDLVVATAFGGKKYGDNPRYIVEKIHELSPETKIVWLSSVDLHADLPAYVQDINFHDKAACRRVLLRASVVIGNNQCFDPGTNRKDQLFIETWHGGLGFKKIGSDSVSCKGRRKSEPKSGVDFYLSNSDHLTKIYRTAFGYKGPVWKCGYPIEDALLTEGNERRLYRVRYGLSDDTRVLVYAPTFRSKYSWRCDLNVAPVLKAFEKRFGGHWAMLVHWHQDMRQEDRVLHGAIDATDTQNLQRLLKAADAFLSDYSSSIFQAVQRHIPCFVYAGDHDAYNSDRGLYYSFDEQPFPFAFDETGLIENILGYQGEKWAERWRRYAVEMGHAVTGRSAEDVARVCVDFLHGKPKEKIMEEIPFETRF